ncbi:hypothetical protein NQ317_016990 [Molorchus minor]|uniref:Nuclease HARBI1 n=1 Tax=Molorchus minor TaxID=1323400 RepID=A0ABQ9IPN6_9CUCU|nr:hypothetical protein NQ317_016990 [Molorchus minor]
MPRTQDEINNNHFAFYEKARFPRVIGSIDCTHIKIQSPGKGTNSLQRQESKTRKLMTTKPPIKEYNKLPSASSVK